jgi:hypothetical protein
MALEITRGNPLPSVRTERGKTRGQAEQPGFEAVRISSSLIAFYPKAIHRPQPYVILLDQGSGILRRVDLQATN